MEYSQIEENYLKAIFKFWHEQEAMVSTSEIANELGVSAASVTDMIQKKLHKKDLVRYEKRQGVALTEKGRKVALNIIRRHRIWEVFLVEKLNFNWRQVHELAEQLEHINSDELIDRLDDFLGNPLQDPHGEIIPDKNGKIRRSPRVLLTMLNPNEMGIIVGVKDDESELLLYLEQVGLVLGTTVTVLKEFQFDKSLLIETSIGNTSISKKIAENLFVEKK